MKIDIGWIKNDNIQKVMELFESNNFSAYVVGGAVRDAIYGISASDLDIATNATPDQVIDMANAAGMRVVPTGIDHGTVSIIIDAQPFEITTFRKDIKTDGRHAEVAFSTDIIADAKRRDFTMNALYADRYGQIHDPLGGLDDVLAHRVRFIGYAQDRIREDYLRILRFFRFYAWYGDPAAGIDSDGLAACSANIEGIASLSRERLGAEMKKLLNAPDPAPALCAMEQSGVLNAVIPGASAQFIAPLIHLESGIAPQAMRRLAALGGEDLSRQLRLSKAETRFLNDVASQIEQGTNPARAAYKLGRDPAIAGVLLTAALTETPPPRDWQKAIQKGCDAVFPVKAADLPPSLTGREIGERLNTLKERWISSDFSLNKQELLS